MARVEFTTLMLMDPERQRVLLTTFPSSLGTNSFIEAINYWVFQWWEWPPLAKWPTLSWLTWRPGIPSSGKEQLFPRPVVWSTRPIPLGISHMSLGVLSCCWPILTHSRNNWQLLQEIYNFIQAQFSDSYPTSILLFPRNSWKGMENPIGLFQFNFILLNHLFSEF